MRKFLSFILKIILLVTVAVWLATNPGEVTLEWLGYDIRTSAAFFTVMMLLLVAAALLVYRGLRLLLDGPRHWVEQQQLRRLEKGQQRLLEGLVAVAAGDAAEAGRKAIAVRKLLAGTPLAGLLQAQAADLAGDRELAREHFRQLLTDSDTAVLGYRGLINLALRDQDLVEAEKYTTELAARRADVPWLHLITYEIARRRGQFAQASQALRQAYVHRQLSSREAKQRQAAVALAEAESQLAANPAAALVAAEQAHALQPNWTPTNLLLAKAQHANQHTALAQRTLRQAYQQEPEAELLALYRQWLPAGAPAQQLQQIQKFCGAQLWQPASQLALAELALAADLPQEAKKHLDWLVVHAPDVRVYTLLANWAEQAAPAEVTHWLRLGLAAPPAPRWHCTECDATYSVWQAQCHNAGAGCGALGSLRRTHAVRLPTAEAASPPTNTASPPSTLTARRLLQRPH